MSTVQFEPKITSDLQIDWRRQASGQSSDLFADLLSDRLKRRVDADQHDPDARRRTLASDPICGRPPRLVIARARTLRGEATEVENFDDRSLPDHTECAADKGCVEAAKDTTETGDSSVGADASTQDETAEADTEAGATGPAQAVDQQDQSTDPVATVVVAVQPADYKVAGDAPELAAMLSVLAPAEDQGVAAGQPESAANATADSARTDPVAATEQQAVAAMAGAALSDVAATLIDGEAEPTGAAESILKATQPTATLAAPTAHAEPPPQMPEAPVPVAEIAPAPAHPRADRSSMDIKLRPGTATRPQASTPDPAPSSGPASQSIQTHQAPLPQQSAASDFSATGETFDQALSTDGSGPGWVLHLAQGAAAKRADFVAQLRQHLQDLPAQEQVAVHIQRALRQGTGKFSIQLSPAELGNIHVKLEIDEDKRVTAAVTVERPSTLELLQRDVKGLERALHNAGLNMEGGDLSFSLGHGDQEFGRDLSRSAASAAGGAVPDAGSEGDQPDRQIVQVMDTAAGVVNLQV